LAAVQNPIRWVLWQVDTPPKRWYPWVSLVITSKNGYLSASQSLSSGCLYDSFYSIPSPVDGFRSFHD